eukprot:CAMPEP_0184717678 /NCGR_PEP_ID=MMETSP0314-20130426/7070_1 /TAXON_ID=38298 /ORGANISM="Rhodella maculata, Strain CCMP 736" /LENGTH=300 /DNA_ID=CAMNT_0027181277 /DNA_START=25 /DNA_END=927 /DNA_ORIENTATION=+
MPPSAFISSYTACLASPSRSNSSFCPALRPTPRVPHSPSRLLSPTMSSPRLNVFPSKAALSESLAAKVTALSAAAIADHASFSVAISGGSLPALLSAGLLATPESTAAVDWAKWKVFLVDERHVPRDDPDSNGKAARESLLESVAVPEGALWEIRPELEVGECARDYAERMRAAGMRMIDHPTAGKVPVLDLVLLGLGEDGHTASLFPGHALLDEASVIIAPIEDSPKPPPSRVTFTYPMIDAAESVVFVATGGGKKEVVKSIFEGAADEVPLPAKRVNPTSGNLEWYVDEDAAALLENK